MSGKYFFHRYKWSALLTISMASFSHAQMGLLWDLNNKVDDLIFQLEMQNLERMDRGFVGTKVFEWPKNLKHLHDEDGGSHFVDTQSVLGNKQSMQANFYVVMPKVKTNKNGTYKAIDRFSVISCDYGTYSEITLTTYKPDYKVDKIYSQSNNLPIKFEPQQSPAEKKNMRYVCGN